tara:strand:+ start:144 stop:764 length:621 start_codon:yes stop_codon:yes gene_type:complete
MRQAADKEWINESAWIYRRTYDDRKSHVYYIRIAQQPHWKNRYQKSLKTTDRELALKKAKKEYDKVMEEQRFVQASIFNKEDLQVASSQAGIGKLGEDRFSALMMIKGYQVYKPEVDVWGRDVILYKDGKWMPTQVKTAKINGNSWQFQTNHSKNKIKYKEVCTHMAFIHLLENRIWFIPSDKIPNVNTMAHSLFKSYLEGYEVVL